MADQSKFDESEKRGKHLRNYVFRRGLWGKVFVNISYQCRPYMVVGVYPGRVAYIDIRYVCGDTIVAHGALINARWDDPLYDPSKAKDSEQRVNPSLVEKLFPRKTQKKVNSSL